MVEERPGGRHVSVPLTAGCTQTRPRLAGDAQRYWMNKWMSNERMTEKHQYFLNSAISQKRRNCSSEQMRQCRFMAKCFGCVVSWVWGWFLILPLQHTVFSKGGHNSISHSTHSFQYELSTPPSWGSWFLHCIESGWTQGLVWAIQLISSDDVPVIDLVLNWPGSFCLLPLGNQPSGEKQKPLK